MYHLIVLNSNPLLGTSWEQGLEIAIMLSDLEQDVKLLIEGEFSSALSACNAGMTVFKKLCQLELLEISTYADTECHLCFAETIDAISLRTLFNGAKTVAVF